MKIPRSRGTRVDIYLSDEIYQKAIRRYRNLDAKIEQLLRYEIQREEEADAKYGFGHPGMSGDTKLDPFEEVEDVEEPSIPQPREEGSAAAEFELNPAAGTEPAPQRSEAPGVPQQRREGKWERLPVLRPKRKRSI